MSLWKLVLAFVSVGGASTFALWALPRESARWVKFATIIVVISTLIVALPGLPQALEGVEKAIKTFQSWLAHDQPPPVSITGGGTKTGPSTEPKGPSPDDGGTTKEVIEHLAKAKAALDSHKYQEAIADATKALRLQSGNSEGLILRGRAYLGIQDYAGAYADGKELAVVKPNSVDPHLLLGFAQLYRQQNADAISHFTNALRIKSDHADALAARSEAYMRTHCLSQALNDANSALRVNSSNWRAYMTRAAVQLKNPHKNCSAAIADAKEVIRRRSDLDSPYVTASEASHCLHDFSAAYDFANKFIQMSPNKWVGYMARGAALAKVDRHQDAIADFTNAIRWDSSQVAPYCARAASYAALGLRDTGYRDHLQCQTLKGEKARRSPPTCSLN